MIGKTLSHFEIRAKLGEGGMGEVYRAEDTSLGRDVAIKVLPEALTNEPERLARFEREAKVLAALNHPNIAGIHQIEEHDGTRFLVMELVEGEDLAERMGRGALAWEDAAAIASQIATGLEAAHQRGIVHRDLKPANVRITPEGQVKILDFGLAKAWESQGGTSPDLSHSPTLTAEMTVAGVILGTAGYMAPEQARGQEADQRSDIWSLGVILWEMLHGRRLFHGATVSDTLAAVLRADIDPELPDDAPWGLGRLLGRCLRRTPEERFHSAADVRIGLADLREGEVGPAAAIPATPTKPIWRHPLVWVLAALLLLASGMAFLRDSGEEAKQVRRLSITLPEGMVVTSAPQLSPDGTSLVFSANDRLYLRRLDEFEPRPIPGTEGGTEPSFSPDGQWIAYFGSERLMRVPAAGGTPQAVADAVDPFGLAWIDDDSLVFVPALNAGLRRVAAAGGPIETLVEPDGVADYAFTWPRSVPGRREIVFAIWGERAATGLLSLDDLSWRKLRPDVWITPSILASGHLLIGDEGSSSLAALPPGLESAPVIVEESVQLIPSMSQMLYTVSADGALVYAPGNPSKRSLVWVDLEGRATEAVAGQDRFAFPSLSADGRRLAFHRGNEVFIHDLERGTETQVPPASRRVDNFQSVWSRDGSRLIFASNRTGTWQLHQKRIGSTGPAELLLEREYTQFPIGAAPDGSIVFMDDTPQGFSMWLLSPEGETQPILPENQNNSRLVFSPDQRLIAYASSETGLSEVYLDEYPPGSERIQVSVGGGRRPIFSPDGRTLYFTRGSSMLAVDLATEKGLRVGRERELFSGPYVLDSFHGPSLAPDGQRFLVVREDPGSVPRQINLVLNWADELEARVPGQ